MSTIVGRNSHLKSRAISTVLRADEHRVRFVCVQCRTCSLSTQFDGLEQKKDRRITSTNSARQFSDSSRRRRHDLDSQVQRRSYSGSVTLSPEEGWRGDDNDIRSSSRWKKEKAVSHEKDDGAPESLSGHTSSERGAHQSGMSSSFFTAESNAGYEAPGMVGDALDTLGEERHSGRVPDIAKHDADARQQILSALDGRHPDQILSAMKILSPDAAAHTLITDDEFSTLLKIVCSNAHVPDMLHEHRTVSAEHARSLQVTPLETVIREYLNTISSLATQRRRSGVRLTSSDYGNMLMATCITGSQQQAEVYWRWMEEDGVVPNRRCYENFLGAHVWNDLLPHHRVRRYNDSFNLMARSAPFRGKPYDRHKIGDGGIKQLTTQIFKRMLDDGIDSNEKTVCHVMVGLAREGDVAAVQKLLVQVWDINPKRITKGDDQPPRQMMGSRSPLHPSDDLLEALAFAFCINGDLPMALRLIDYTSRHFGLKPKDGVWEFLLQWTHVLSRPIREESTLEPQAAIMLWETMLAEPYNVKPTVEMIDFMVRAYMTLGKPDEMLDTMNQGLDTFLVGVQRRDAALADLRHAAETCGAAKLEAKRKKLDQLTFRVSRHALLLKSWTRLLLGLSSSPNPRQGSFALVDVPGLVAGRWRRFLPRKVQYYTDTGHVKLWRLDDAEVLEEQRRMRATSLKRQALLDRARLLVGDRWAQSAYSTRRLRDSARGSLEEVAAAAMCVSTDAAATCC